MIYDIVINGIATSGKDTFVDLVDQNHSDLMVNNFSSIDPFRLIPQQFGWDGEKNDEYRMCLHLLKEASTHIMDYPNRYLKFKREEALKYNGLFQDIIFFYHIREHEDIERFLKMVPTAKVLLIKRNCTDIPESDMCVLDCSYDYVIENNSNLDSLKESAHMFIKLLKGHTND